MNYFIGTDTILQQFVHLHLSLLASDDELYYHLDVMLGCLDKSVDHKE